MQWFVRGRALWAHIALAMMVMAFAAPTVSRVLHAVQAQTSPWGLVCSAEVAPGGESAPATPSLEHCPLCVLQQAASAPPPAALHLPLPSALSQLQPRLLLQAPHPLFAWSAAQPRAPPHA